MLLGRMVYIPEEERMAGALYKDPLSSLGLKGMQKGSSEKKLLLTREGKETGCYAPVHPPKEGACCLQSDCTEDLEVN